MYKEGRQFVVDTKKEIDGVIKDVKSIQTDAKGIFNFFRKLFRSEKAEEIKVGTNPVKPKQKKRVEFDENQIYAQVADA